MGLLCNQPERKVFIKRSYKMSHKELAEFIIEQTSDALIYADNHGNIQRWNDAASQLFGFSKDEA